MRRRGYVYGLIVLAIGFLAACSSSKQAPKETTVGKLPEAVYVEQCLSRPVTWETVTAKMSVEVNPGRGKSPVSVSGTLRMKRGEVIQLSIAPFLGIEVGRAEITPDGLLVLDRIHKRYVQVPFAELKEIAKADLDFHALQALFFNEVFLPGKGSLTADDVPAFRVQPADQEAWLEVRHPKRFTYRFLTAVDGGWLKETYLGLTGTPYGILWRYGDFRPLDNGRFPHAMTVTFEGGSQPAGASFGFSRLSTRSDWEVHTEIPAKYEPVDWRVLLEKLF